MALQPQIVPISLAGGLDTKTDDKQVIPGDMLLLENAVFVNPKKYKKRNGQQSLGVAIEGELAIITAGRALMQFNDELNLCDGNSLFSFSEASRKYSRKGVAVSLNVKVDPVIRNSYQQTNANSAYHPNGFILETWDDSRGGSRYAVIDRSTGQYVLSDALLPATALFPKPYALGMNFVILYIDSVSHNLNFVSIQITTPTVLSAPVAIAVNVNIATPTYDACLNNGNLYIAYNNSDGGGGISVKFISPFLVGSVTRDVAGESATLININGDASFNVWITYYNGTQVKGFVWNAALGPLITLAPTIIETVPRIVNVTAFTDGTTAHIFYEQTSTTLLSYNELIRQNTLTIAGVVGAPSVFLRSVGLYSKPFFYNGRFYFMVTFQDDLQPTYFCVRSDGVVVAKIATQLGGGLTTRLTEVSQISPGVFGLAYLIKDLLTSIGGKIFTQTGVQRLEFDFTNNAVFLREELGNNLHLTGGIVSMYDGISVVEHNFHLYPESPNYIPVISGGGIGPGVYSWVAVYEWTDNFGQIQRGTPSIPTQETVGPGTPINFTGNVASGDKNIFNVSSTAGLVVGQTITGPDIPANTHIVTINALALQIIMDNEATATVVGEALQTVDTNRAIIATSTLRLTEKKPPTRTPVSIVFYRTEANGTIYRRVSSVTVPILNDVTVDDVGFIDDVPDLVLIGNQELYTTAELEDFAAPAITSISSYRNRIMYNPSENRSQIGYSKQVLPGEPVEFSPEFILNINAKGGDITAHIEMDTNFIIWKNQFIFAMTGEGPGADGSNDDFTQPQLIPSPVGCDNPRSLVLTPQGVIFHSDQGFWLLERGLSVVYIGSQVEEFNDLNVTGALQIPNTTQIKFTTDSGITLVYDYFVGKWAVHKNQAAVDCCLFQRLFIFLQSDGQAKQETPGVFNDDGQYIVMKFITSWLAFANIQAYQRVWHMLLVGTYYTPHRLMVGIAHDYNPAIVQQTIIQAGQLLQPQAYGAGSPYGDPADIPFGGSFPDYEFQINIKQQKCEAIQFTIQDVGDLPYGEGFDLSAMTFELGVKKGTDKLAAARKFG